MTAAATQAVSRRSGLASTLRIVLLLHAWFLLERRGHLLLEESHSYGVGIVLFRFFCPTTPIELILIFAELALVATLWIRSHRRMGPEPTNGDIQAGALSKAPPLSRASFSLGWSLFWPLFVLNASFQFSVLFVPDRKTSALLHLAFFATLPPLTLHLLRRLIRRRYGFRPVGVAWAFLWRCMGIALLAEILFMAYQAASTFNRGHSRLVVLEWLAARAVLGLVQCVGLGWAAHRCLVRHERKVEENGPLQKL